MVSRSVWDREGGGSSPPWVTNSRIAKKQETTFQFGSSPKDRIAGYEPADEGSSPSPNTISSRRSRVTIYAIHTLSVAPCSFRASTARPFQVTRPGLSLGVLIWAKGSTPFYLTFRRSSLIQSAENIQCTPCSCQRAAANWVTRDSELWVQSPPPSSFQCARNSMAECVIADDDTQVRFLSCAPFRRRSRVRSSIVEHCHAKAAAAGSSPVERTISTEGSPNPKAP
jgi:hypothetical protein